MSSFKADEAFKDGTWYHEKLEEVLVYSHKVNSVNYDGNSKFQRLQVLDLVPFSRALFCDGLLQSTYADEYVYHECLVHPSLLAHPNPKNVFIGGGGEGGTLRECLRHSSVEKVTMVDIDEELVKLCKEYQPLLGAGAFSDPRAVVKFDDAKAELEQTLDGSLDVIILDLCDPLDGGPCYALYTIEFYTMCHRKLSEKGVIVTQTGNASVHEVVEKGAYGVFSPVYNTLKRAFPKVFGYTAFVPSFASEWGWVMGCKDPEAVEIPSRTDVDARLHALGLDSTLKYYDQITHRRMFQLSKPVRQVLANEKRVIDLKNPMFMTNANTGIVKAS